MPTMQAMVERLNWRFNRDNIGEIDPAVLAPDVPLAEAARALEIAVTDAEVAYLSSWPVGQQEAIRAALQSAVRRRLPVTFAWAPGYDYELSIWEAAGTPQSLGGMTLFVRSPYPSRADRPTEAA